MFPNEYAYVAVTINGIKYGTSYLNVKDVPDDERKCRYVYWTEVVDKDKADATKC